MARSATTRNVAAFVGALVLVSVVAVLATGAFGRSVTPEPVPSEAPAETPAPTPQPTAAPSPTPASDITFDLDVATAHDVSVDGRIIVTVDQAAPPANSDAIGHDRVVEIDFGGAVSADDVRVTVSN